MKWSLFVKSLVFVIFACVLSLKADFSIEVEGNSQQELTEVAYLDDIQLSIVASDKADLKDFSLILSSDQGTFGPGCESMVLITPQNIKKYTPISFKYEGNEGLALVHLRTAQETSVTLNEEQVTVSPTTEIFQLAVFDMTLEVAKAADPDRSYEAITLAIDYDGLNYVPPVRDSQPVVIEPLAMAMSVPVTGSNIEWATLAEGCDYPDFDNNYTIDLADFAVMANNWQQTGTGNTADINSDNSVDLTDLYVMAGLWLDKASVPPFVHSFEQMQGVGIDLADREDSMHDYVDSLVTYASFAYEDANMVIPDWFVDVIEIEAEDNEDFLANLEADELLVDVEDLENVFMLAGQLAFYGWDIEISDFTSEDNVITEVSHLISLESDTCFTDQGDKQYQYLTIESGGKLERDFKSSVTSEVVRINCLPEPGLAIEFINEDVIAGGIYFGTNTTDPNTISYLSNGNLTEQSLAFNTVSAYCKANRATTDDSMTDEYEKSWIDLEIHLDWTGGTYDAYWNYDGLADKQLIIDSATLISDGMDKMTLSVDPNSVSSDINRISVSNNTTSGGVIGTDCVVALASSENVNLLRGDVGLNGDIWFDQLGQYKIMAMPENAVNYDIDDIVPPEYDGSNSTLQPHTVYQSINTGDIHAAWKTDRYQNDNYTLTLEIQDDIGRVHQRSKIDISDSNNGMATVANIIPASQSYYYEDSVDLRINWPGSFPFEFKRIYSSTLSQVPVPLGYGWTHNHNIRITEDCRSDWETLTDNSSAEDSLQLGMGKIWLQQGASTRLFTVESPDSNESDQKYIAADNDSDYIIRSHNNNEVDDLSYVVYLRDGMELYFEPELSNFDPNDPNSPTDGITGWTASGGIQKMQDRFGNALEYEWACDGACIKRITNNRTDAAMQFDLLRYGATEYPFYEGVKGGTYHAADFTEKESHQFRFDVNYLVHYGKINSESPDIFALNEFYYTERSDGKILLTDVLTSSDRHSDRYHFYAQKVIKYNNKGEYIGEAKIRHEDLGLFVFGDSYSADEGYFYKDSSKVTSTKETDDPNTSQRIDIYRQGGNIYKKIERTLGAEGQILSIISRYKFQDDEFDCFDYDTVAEYADIYLAYGFPNNFEPQSKKIHYNSISGIADYFYEYEDSRFPAYPTTIRICYDEDGDQNNAELKDYDSERIIKKSYDSHGNVLWQKNYVDNINYVLTEFDYHPDYNFTTSQTTYQDYCSDDPNGNINYPTAAKVQKLWVYGDANGIEDPNGMYLIQEKQLLDQDTDTWAVKSFKYNTMGNPYQLIDAENNINYIQYDENGFKEKIWQGVSQTPPIGDPQTRYCYNEYGRKLLEADNLGKVTRYDYFYEYTIESRTIYDDTAISRTDFNLDAYPDVTYQEQGDYLTLEGSYNSWVMGHPRFTIGSDGWKEIEWGFFEDEVPQKIITGVDYMVSGNGVSTVNYMAGFENTVYYKVNGRNCVDTPGSFVYSSLDSNNRVMERYSGLETFYDFYNSALEPVKIAKHERFDYTASGKKKSEKIYSVDIDNQASRKLEKYSEFTYDALDRMIGQYNYTDPNDTSIVQIVEYGYDAVGNKIYTVDPAGKVIFTDYDNANRKTKTYYPAEPVLIFGVALDIEATKDTAIVDQIIEYDNNGQVTKVLNYEIDGSLISGKEICYDERQRVEQTVEYVDDPNDLAITTIEYSDSLSNFSVVSDPNYHICMVDPEGKATLTRLHAEGKPEQILYSSGDYELMDYDGLGRMVNKAVWDGSVRECVQYEYNDRGKLSRKTYPDGGYIEYDYRKLYASTANIKLFYSYSDVLNSTQLCHVYDCRTTDNPFTYSGDPNDPAPTYSFEYYEHNGKLKSYTMPDDIKIDYTYNEAFGSKKSVVVSKDGVEKYRAEYDNNLLGQLETVNDGSPNNPLAYMEYDANGNREYMYYPRIDTGGGYYNYNLHYTYNIRNQLTNIASTFGYSFDAGFIDGMGRLANGTENIVDTSGVNSTIQQSFDYNMRSELTDWTIGSTQTTYDLDLAGNIQSQTDGLNTSNYIYVGDLMIGIGSEAASWDNNGRVTDKGSAVYDWDYDHKLRAVDNATEWMECRYYTNGTMAWQYSGVSGISTGQYKRFIYDNVGRYPKLLLVISEDESEGTPQTTESIYWANGTTVGSRVDNGDIYYNLHDRLGSVRLVIDEYMNVVNRFDFDPYGNHLTTDYASGSDYRSIHRFADYKWDDISGMYNCNARWYDPAMMRFISRDPVRGGFEEPLTLHRYLYCLNDPVNRIDSSGEMSLNEQVNTQAIGNTVEYASGAYDAAGMVKDYATMVINGASLANVLKSVAIDVVMDKAGGKMFEYFANAGGRIMKTISNRKVFEMAGKGSTGRSVPKNLKEELAMLEALSDPEAGKWLEGLVNDSKHGWFEKDGWRKYSQNNGGVEVHYLYNWITKELDDFKFKY